jgi:uncharacterized protein (TIGR00290 family)
VPRAKERILLAWSGGKDSALALDELKRTREFEITGLVTALTPADERVTMNGVPRALIEAQARALGLPVEFVTVSDPSACGHAAACSHLGAMLAAYAGSGISKVAFGDVYLDDLRDVREECLESVGMEAIFPLWHRCTKELAYAFVERRFKAVVTCVDGESLDDTFVGRSYDRAFLADLPLAADPCGENGEFRTFVFDGPGFKAPVTYRLGDKYDAEGRRYCEITASTRSESRRRVRTAGSAG